MSLLIIKAKVASFLENELYLRFPDVQRQLISGDLHSFETFITQVMNDLYNVVVDTSLKEAAQAAQPEIRTQAAQLGLGKLVERPLRIQIRTGAYVTVKSLYAKQVRRGYTGRRHLLSAHWRMIRGASPAYYRQVGLTGVLCPSFEVANSVLSIQGVATNRDRIQDVCQDLARHCKAQEARLSLRKGETMAAKRVLIGIDGGRCRMRQYTKGPNEAGEEQFETPWMEPKIFVIEVLNAAGNIERTELPLYGCRFGDDDVINLLSSYLSALQIEKAACVQVVADGAPWIWKRLRPLLESLGVTADKIIETLDYYHASQYVHKIVQALPQQLKQTSTQLLKTCKELLWEGKIQVLLDKVKPLFKKQTKDVKRYLGYLTKNQGRMEYQHYRDRQLVCGSGVVESGVRRVINLRFKNSSSFWKIDNVEGLFFLRGIFLAYRWNTMIYNVTKSKF
jgi:hypothetical protein